MNRDILKSLEDAPIQELIDGAGEGLQSEDPNVRDRAVRLIHHGGLRGLPQGQPGWGVSTSDSNVDHSIDAWRKAQQLILAVRR